MDVQLNVVTGLLHCQLLYYHFAATVHISVNIYGLFAPMKRVNTKNSSAQICLNKVSKLFHLSLLAYDGLHTLFWEINKALPHFHYHLCVESLNLTLYQPIKTRLSTTKDVGISEGGENEQSVL